MSDLFFSCYYFLVVDGLFYSCGGATYFVRAQGFWIIEFVLHVSGDGFNGGSDSYLLVRDTHASFLLKLCITSSNGIVRWRLFPEFVAELPLDNCTPTIILNNLYLIDCG